jgi:hypothetical protein
VQLFDGRNTKKREEELQKAREKDNEAFLARQRREENDVHFAVAAAAIEEREKEFKTKRENALTAAKKKKGGDDEDGAEKKEADKTDTDNDDDDDELEAAPESPAVTKARDEFNYRRLQVSEDERLALAGLLRANVPLHLAVEHLRLIQRLANLQERDQDLRAPEFPAVDEYMDHGNGTGFNPAASREKLSFEAVMGSSRDFDISATGAQLLGPSGGGRSKRSTAPFS